MRNRQRRSKSRGFAYPDIEVEVLVVDRLDVEAYGGNGRYDFANLSERVSQSGAWERHQEQTHLESVEKCCLSGVVLARGCC